jgi:hypothetical protein
MTILVLWFLDRQLYGRSGAQVVAAFVKEDGGGIEYRVVIKAVGKKGFTKMNLGDALSRVL